MLTDARYTVTAIISSRDDERRRTRRLVTAAPPLPAPDARARGSRRVSTRITTPPDLTRTLAALADYDVIDAEIADDMTESAAVDFFARLDVAKKAIGEAFALDTSDRNEPEVARSWAAFNVERTREFVTRLTRTSGAQRGGLVMVA